MNDMNYPYIFSLLPHILVYKVQSRHHVSAQSDVYPHLS